MQVLFDANALMIPVQFGVDVFTGVEELVGAFEPVTLVGVNDELVGLSHGQGRNAAAARVGATLASRCSVVRSPYQTLPVDDRIVRYAEENGCIVVTNDRHLREELLRRHIDVIYLREKKRLDIIRG
ncbi:type II toxin-antitoxin system VapC family toxin [Methanogenium organophilum]|uniref:Nucleotide-binding protein n=1 Tax=Methanogenium organophilum TaxID=2199 RepID=A0A9X9S1W5_METOG|nr:PIN domain-containing protein [Methanogenium organophilum]WAI00317.1 nucleotide-binding protein [Methanogenium organophilum]